ncbi:hypothetical protein C8K38_105173 [Rhodococcus sp. OK611]|uniref:hypothetical protein n=1 Tax=unclassified Rhodococcus (in: high G+C Gram-positive bacteria) TaxID=192944 RepID=UPI000BDCFC8F|nr:MULTISPECIES: hypothetical protein [unclassified Rhodococcus (in: high G+C Gram-positive bacteria)]PTR44094.1 hypothetical protein C8K38_105173 [Rhodococcus sp. OK611]SNX90396.1 hypothetical protein SAMN05447004_105173 [Rhodococcus sp. OK270]
MLATSALLLGLGVASALADRVPGPAVPPAKVVGPGTTITFDDYTEYGYWCTRGAGTDSAGRKVGITAGHCNPQVDPDNPTNDPDHTDADADADADGNKIHTAIVGPARGTHT